MDEEVHDFVINTPLVSMRRSIIRSITRNIIRRPLPFLSISTNIMLKLRIWLKEVWMRKFGTSLMKRFLVLMLRKDLLLHLMVMVL
jgi:hypothetical protein